MEGLTLKDTYLSRREYERKVLELKEIMEQTNRVINKLMVLNSESVSALRLVNGALDDLIQKMNDLKTETEKQKEQGLVGIDGLLRKIRSAHVRKITRKSDNIKEA